MPRLTKNEDVCIACHRCETICAWVHNIVFNPKKGRIIVDLDYPDTHKLRICIQCGRCADACPMDAIYQDFSILTTSEQGIYRLDECYEARGWDKTTGWPTSEKLAALGLDYVAKDLEKAEPALRQAIA